MKADKGDKERGDPRKKDSNFTSKCVSPVANCSGNANLFQLALADREIKIDDARNQPVDVDGSADNAECNPKASWCESMTLRRSFMRRPTKLDTNGATPATKMIRKRNGKSNAN